MRPYGSTNQRMNGGMMEHIDLCLKFSFYLLQSLNLTKYEKSTAIPGLNRNDAYTEPILLPPLPEQSRIVAKIEELLSELDKGIESFKTAREQLKVYRQALPKHAFEGKLTAAWREENKDKLETSDALLKRIQSERSDRYKQQVKEWEKAVKSWEKGGKKGSKPGYIAHFILLSLKNRMSILSYPAQRFSFQTKVPAL